jgi:type III secretion protein F
MSTFDYSTINNTVGNAVTAKDAEIAQFQSTMDSSSTTDSLKLQQMIQEWSLLVSLQSTLTKEVGDALKGVLQKMN